MANVWGSTGNSGESNISFSDVLSEELAASLAEPQSSDHVSGKKSPYENARGAEGGQEAFSNRPAQSEGSGLFVDLDDLSGSPRECLSDEMLAKILQRDFDREHDQYIGQVQSKTNGSSRISVSFDNFRRSRISPSQLPDSDSEDEEEEDETDRKPWDEYERAEKSPAVTVGRSGVAKNADGSMTTKHDPAICGRANARRVMDLSEEVAMGDGGGMDLKLNNRDYNVLRTYSNKQSKRAARLHEKKEKSTAEGVMDERTKLVLFKLVNNGILDEVNGCINTGKEANVYHGLGGNVEEMIIPGEVAIKVFKTTLNEFKHRDPYIKDDFRFSDRFSAQNGRKMIHLWAEKEKHNLNRLRKGGILAPEVVLLKKHVLVMQFLGKDARCSPTLKEARLEDFQLEKAYKETLDIMCRMYSKCDLIHSDLSEYNLLWHENHIWVIDVGQAVLRAHPNAMKFLYRDCCNISSYFNKRGLADVLSPEELFQTITKKSVLNEQGQFSLELLEKLDDFEKDLELLTIGDPEKEDPFEEMLEKSMQERLAQSLPGTSPVAAEPKSKPVPQILSKKTATAATAPNKLSKSPPKAHHYPQHKGGGSRR